MKALVILVLVAASMCLNVTYTFHRTFPEGFVAVVEVRAWSPKGAPVLEKIVIPELNATYDLKNPFQAASIVESYSLLGNNTSIYDLAIGSGIASLKPGRNYTLIMIFDVGGSRIERSAVLRVPSNYTLLPKHIEEELSKVLGNGTENDTLPRIAPRLVVGNVSSVLRTPPFKPPITISLPKPKKEALGKVEALLSSLPLHLLLASSLALSVIAVVVSGCGERR